jgi:type II secretory pathway component PulK
VLLVTLFIVLIAVILAQVMLSILRSHSRLSHHQVSRIQAQYAAMAGVVYAYDSLRSGHLSSSDCPEGNSNPKCRVDDNNFPVCIKDKRVKIILCPAGATCAGKTCPVSNNLCIYSTAEYTYN